MDLHEANPDISIKTVNRWFKFLRRILLLEYTWNQRYTIGIEGFEVKIDKEKQIKENMVWVEFSFVNLFGYRGS